MFFGELRDEDIALPTNPAGMIFATRCRWMSSLLKAEHNRFEDGELPWARAHGEHRPPTLDVH
jgi:hypothetical protein